jgi:hypothetical protein
VTAADAPDDEAALPPDGDVLSEVRGFLDVLDVTRAAPGLLSTTIEMAAVPPSAVAPGAGAARTRLRAWWLATAAVASGLVAGLVAGWATGPDPDEPVLQYLPVVEHLDALQEAGSTAFLEELAKRGIAEPRRFPFPRPQDEPPGGEGAGDEGWPEFDDAVEALRYVTFGPETPPSEIASRRDHIEEMDDDELRHVADRVTAYRLLSREVRHDLIELARALGESDDERLDRLVAAARVWHRWVDWSDPADRQAVVALDRDDRLEWLERRTRFPGRGQWPGGRSFPGGRGFNGDGGRAVGPVTPRPDAEAPPRTPPAPR